MTGRRGWIGAVIVVLALASSVSATACSSDFDAQVGPCRLTDLGMAPPMSSTTMSTDEGPAPSTTVPADTIVQLSVSNTMSETKGRVLLTVDQSGLAVATGKEGGGAAQLDPEAMARLTTCITDSGFTQLDADYPDQMSPKRPNGHFCGVSDASEYSISVQGVTEPRTVTAYGLDIDLDQCDLGHPQALQQVYAGLTALREQVAAVGH